MRSPSDPTVNTDFYLYFPDEMRARRALQGLAAESYSAHLEYSEDAGSWLLLATKSIRMSSMEAVETWMESLATANGGEYDGNEINLEA